MKRSILAVTFLLLIISGIFWGMLSLKKAGTEITDIIEECEAFIKSEDYVEATKNIERIYAAWEEKKLLTAVLSGNGKTHSIDISLESVKIRMESGDWKETLFQLGLLREEVKSIFTSEEANAENIV
ncbi:MAG: DUF4363 family protein [Oscillospiraceae bacterium]